MSLDKYTNSMAFCKELDTIYESGSYFHIIIVLRRPEDDAI